MARQRRLTIDGEDDHIGLVFYHRALRCLVLVDLLLSSQTNRLRVAQYLLPEDTAALKARLAQMTAAYEGLHGGAADGA